MSALMRYLAYAICLSPTTAVIVRNFMTNGCDLNGTPYGQCTNLEAFSCCTRISPVMLGPFSSSLFTELDPIQLAVIHRSPDPHNGVMDCGEALDVGFGSSVCLEGPLFELGGAMVVNLRCRVDTCQASARRRHESEEGFEDNQTCTSPAGGLATSVSDGHYKCTRQQGYDKLVFEDGRMFDVGPDVHEDVRTRLNELHSIPGMTIEHIPRDLHDYEVDHENIHRRWDF